MCGGRGGGGVTFNRMVVMATFCNEHGFIVLS